MIINSIKLEIKIKTQVKQINLYKFVNFFLQLCWLKLLFPTGSNVALYDTYVLHFHVSMYRAF